MGAYESGQSFMAGVLAKLPAELRAQAETIFHGDLAKEAVTLAGDGALARSDYSRNMDTLREKERELTAYYERLNGWYADNKSALDQAREQQTPPATPPATPPGNGNGTGGGAPDLSAALTAAEIRRIAEERANAAAGGSSAATASLSTRSAPP